MAQADSASPINATRARQVASDFPTKG